MGGKTVYRKQSLSIKDPSIAGDRHDLPGDEFPAPLQRVPGRVMAYLNSIAIQKNRTEFDIPFDRQQMADYLNVERTALSKELGKMKKDGLIDYHRRRFILRLM